LTEGTKLFGGGVGKRKCGRKRNVKVKEERGFSYRGKPLEGEWKEWGGGVGKGQRGGTYFRIRKTLGEGPESPRLKGRRIEREKQEGRNNSHTRETV